MKINAIDSLCIGKTLKSYQRLSYLSEDKNYLVRGYAILSHFEVYTNCFGLSQHNQNRYIDYVNQKLLKENNLWVIIALNQVLYSCGIEEGLNTIMKMLFGAVTDDNIELLWILLHTLEEVINDDNKGKVLKELLSIVDKVIPAQKYFIENLNKEYFS